MTTKTIDSTVSCIPSTEIRVYKDYKDAPPISGVYVFEVEKGLVKCGMSSNVKKRFIQLVDIKKHREVSLHGRATVLPVDEDKLKRAESAFFELLSGNIEGTELFKISFERALKALRRLYENNPPSMFHLTDEEKAEKELRKQRARKSLKPLDIALIRNRYAHDRAVAELEVSRLFSEILEVFPESDDEISLERFIGEYRHYLYLVNTLLSPKVWEETFQKEEILYSAGVRLDDVTSGRMGALALRLHSVTYSYKDVLKSPAYPRTVVYHAANLVSILRDIKNLYSEIVEVDEKCEGKYPDHVLNFFKEVRDTAYYFIEYLIARFIVTIARPEQDVSYFRDVLHSRGKRLHRLLREDEMIV